MAASGWGVRRPVLERRWHPLLGPRAGTHAGSAARGPSSGTVTHLDEYQAYQKVAGDATLRITLSDLLLQTIDANADTAAWECPGSGPCEPVRTIVRVHARAYASSTDGDFFSVGGVAYLVGHARSWRPGAATSADSPGPLWGEQDFRVDGDADDSGTGAAGQMFLAQPLTIHVLLDAVPVGELFAVHVSLEATAIVAQEGETAAQAFVQDPQELDPGSLLVPDGLEPRDTSGSDEPPTRPLAPATCPDGTPPDAGALALAEPLVTVDESGRAALVLVTRTGGSAGEASAVLEVMGGSADAGADLDPAATTIRFADGDASPRVVEVPIHEDSQAEPEESFGVALGDVHCATLGSQDHATVTILDDDQVLAPTAPPGLMVGGTVEGLLGSGLVLTNLGTEVAVASDGPFAFPGTHADGESYEVRVRTQPHDPGQACHVEHGAGRVAGADVTDILVRCETPSSAGLDATFGDAGRVSTPMGGAAHGEAVVIAPDGSIVTAGWRATGSGNDIALTRHDAAGTLDSSFGDDGVATIDLGGADDEASDAALAGDGSVVVMGRSDAAGPSQPDIAIVRVGRDGLPDPGFGTAGIVRTDVLGGWDQGDAIAAQPDGRLVVVGSAVRDGIDGDLALVRYEPDGTLDGSFGTDGTVTTDLGTQADEGRALAIGPDGRIVVAGIAGEDIALARYLPDGTLDGSFGSGGTTIIDLGFDDVADGVALAPDGAILIAGTTVGAGGDRDLLLARVTSDGRLDATFGAGGILTTDLGGGDDFGEGLVVDDDGRIVVVGRATSPTILDLALERVRPDGTLDDGFGAHGVLTADFHGAGDLGEDVALDADGRIVAVGTTADGAATEFALLRAMP
ncbi:MAG: Calx-beta domain-containing protein [Chloroflexota bacterium]